MCSAAYVYTIETEGLTECKESRSSYELHIMKIFVIDKLWVPVVKKNKKKDVYQEYTLGDM